MKAQVKEKLIETVRKYECLYNTKHNDYKNKNHKLLMWERIGASLGIEGNTAKETWRTLRDGYVRYRKQIAGKTGSGRKYSHYMWSSQLDFLDGTLELRPTNTALHAGPSHEETSEPGSPDASSQLPLPMDTYYLPLAMPSPERSIKVENGINITEEKSEVLDYLQHKNRETQEYDDVDHLFTSYAKTFKKLSPRNKADLKIRLAKIFAEAELRELN